MTLRIRHWLPTFGMACLLLMAWSMAEAAGGTAMAVRKTIENSMLVTGWIEIGADGAATGHSLDQPDKLPPFVRDLAGKAAAGFRFEPIVIDGKPVRARARMGLRVVASKQDNGDYRVRLASASFGDEQGKPGESVHHVQMKPPMYPKSAYTSGISGTVYLVLKIDRAGKVEQAVAEQTNLTVVGNTKVMEQGREVLERASIAAARKWQFAAPTEGDSAREQFWSVRVPVDYRLVDDVRKPGQDELKTPYGKWEAYVPGPKNRIPWLSDEENRQSPEALIAGTAHPVGSGPKLVTPLGG